MTARKGGKVGREAPNAALVSEAIETSTAMSSAPTTAGCIVAANPDVSAAVASPQTWVPNFADAWLQFAFIPRGARNAAPSATAAGMAHKPSTDTVLPAACCSQALATNSADGS